MNKLDTYHNKLFSNFFKSFEVARSSSSMNDIHKVRLSIKKIKSLNDLIQQFDSTQKYSTGYKKELKKVFQSAGLLREQQIHLKILKKKNQEVFEIYFKSIQQNYKENLQNLGKSLRLISVDEIENNNNTIEKKLKKINTDQIKEQINSYIYNKLLIIGILEKYAHLDEVLHDIRTEFRNIRDALLLCQELKIGSSYNTLLKELNPLIETIGNWHDLNVLNLVIVQLREETKGKKSKKIIDQYLTTNIKKELKLKDKILKKEIGLII